ncbi:unnamed protein product [Ceratitis capitata]|uniref:(Mediterranean fruit fly) hypothetical protein n=1 Tax=Ceratitis capitata TaxID=7213 RepID=A0A811V4R4_CERCA|nr:unnamed protein product [Ceratitis capitata]
MEWFLCTFALYFLNLSLVVFSLLVLSIFCVDSITNSQQPELAVDFQKPLGTLTGFPESPMNISRSTPWQTPSDQVVFVVTNYELVDFIQLSVAHSYTACYYLSYNHPVDNLGVSLPRSQNDKLFQIVSSELNISKSVVFELFSAPASLKIFKFLGEKHFYWKLNDFCTSEYFIEPPN